MPNDKENQHCFSCAHFQPYSSQLPPAANNGECRAHPQVGMLVGDLPSQFNQYWPYLENGDNFWCSNWKQTRLTPIVQTGTPREPSWPTDWENFHTTPWNIREPLNESCWSCNHYQYSVADPSEPGENTGQCRKGPPPPVLDMVVAENGDTLQPSKFVYSGSSFCCSDWEHARGTVPVDPGPVPQ